MHESFYGLNRLEVKTLLIEPSSRWANDYIESFKGKLQDELLNGEAFTTLHEVQILIADRQQPYNHLQPQSLSVLQFSQRFWRFTKTYLHWS